MDTFNAPCPPVGELRMGYLNNDMDITRFLKMPNRIDLVERSVARNIESN